MNSFLCSALCKKKHCIYFLICLRGLDSLLYFDFGKILDIIIKIKGYAMILLGRLN